MSDITDKYYETDKSLGSRTARNSELYREINKTELDSFEVKSNATIIGNNKENIDVEKLKSILDTHYNEAPKRRSIKIDDIPQREERRPIIETKEYDINVILNKAREEKKVDYEEDRAKRLRNTQFDILNNLNIDPKDYVEDYEEEDKKHMTNTSSKELEDLINTITLNEKGSDESEDEEDTYEIQPTEEIEQTVVEEPTEDDIKVDNSIEETSTINEDTPTDPLEMFEDLKGSDNTTVLKGLSEKAEKMIEDIEQTTSLDKSFFTKSSSFKKSDFEDYDDFAELEEKGIKPIFKIIIAILIIAFIVGIVILVKSLF